MPCGRRCRLHGGPSTGPQTLKGRTTRLRLPLPPAPRAHAGEAEAKQREGGGLGNRSLVIHERSERAILRDVAKKVRRYKGKAPARGIGTRRCQRSVESVAGVLAH